MKAYNTHLKIPDYNTSVDIQSKRKKPNPIDFYPSLWCIIRQFFFYQQTTKLYGQFLKRTPLMGPTPHPPFLEKSKEELKLHKVEEEEMIEIGIQWHGMNHSSPNPLVFSHYVGHDI